MAASRSTVKKMVQIIVKYMSRVEAKKMLHELCKVPANKSVKDTLYALKLEMFRKE